jgi:autotransporter-associated beta strand protein
MKTRLLVSVSLALAALAGPGRLGAADVVKANNLNSLELGTSWVGGTAPTSADTAVFDSTFATVGALNTAALVQWSGVRVTSPSGAVLINNSTAPNNVAIGAGGVDLSSATTNLVIRRFQLDASQTWNIAAGRSFRIGSTAATFAPAANDAANNRVGVFSNNAPGALITKTGAGVAYLDMGNTTLGNVNWQVNAGTLAAIWNQANAFGAGTITLAGGGLAVGTPVAGSVGNWTWNNPITLQTATTSFIDNQNTGGSDRWLKLEGPIGGSGNLEFRDTGVGFNNLNFGFILAGSNTMSGTVTIATNAEVRVGGTAPGLTTNPAGPYGGLGTATIVNQGWLTLARTDFWLTTNNLSGTGSVRVGSETLVGTDAQFVTVYGAWTHTGNTLINRGTLALGAGSSLPNTAEIYLNAPNVETTTLDVSAIAPYTLGSGRKLIGRGTTGQQVVNGSLIAAAGSVLVPGGSNTFNTLTFNNDLALNGGTVLMDVSSANWDRLQVNGNFSASGVTTIQCVQSGPLTTGEYPLIQIGGTRGGSTNNFVLTGLLSAGTRQSFALAYGTPTYPNDIVLVVGGSAPANLTWVGGTASNTWNVDGAVNWDNAGSPDKFFNNDAVSFTDSGSTNPPVNLVGVLLPATVTVNASTDYTFSGPGAIAGAATLTKSGPGKLTVANTNTYTGVTTVSGGTLAVSSGAAIPDAGTVNVDTGGAAFQVAASETIATLNTVAGTTVDVAAGTLTYTNGSLLGALTGAGTLARYGTADTALGQLTSVDALAFTGTLRLRGSTPSLNPGSMQGATGRFWLHSTAGSQLAGTQFHLDTGASISNAQDVIVGDWDADSGNRRLKLASLSGYGSLRSDAGGDGVRHIIVDQAVDTTYHGMILAHASTHTTPFRRSVWFEKLGAGTLTMANVMGRQTASASGTTNADYFLNVGGGKLVLLATNTLDGPITVASGATLEVGGAGLLGNGVYPHAITNHGTLTFNSTADQTLAGEISGSGGIVKNNPGTLRINGTLTNGSFTINGGLLGGAGVIQNAVSLPAASGLAPGPTAGAIGTLTINNALTLNAGSTHYFDVDATNGVSDRVEFTSATLAGSLVVSNLSGPGTLTNGQSFAIFSAGGTGGFASITPAPGAGQTWSFNPATGLLTVVPAMNTTPTNLNFTVSGGDLVLSWPASHTGWILQAQTNTASVGLTTNGWFDLPGSAATNQVTITPNKANPTVFYRLRLP